MAPLWQSVCFSLPGLFGARTSMVDGSLRKLFRQQLPGHWQSIETGAVGRGVADSNYCIDGIEGWVEFKQTTGWTVDLRPEQIGWLQRRARAGGRVNIAVRQKARSGPRREARDILWLFKGDDAAFWKSNGLSTLTDKEYMMTLGGPSVWDWRKVQNFLTE